MKIALIGYGKMGKVIEGLALAAGDEVVLKVDEHNRDTVTAAELAAADVAIEFTRPEAAIGNIDLVLEAGIPVVVGTTGWLNELPTVRQRVQERGGGLFWASNFSVGVNVFFAVARRMAELLGEDDSYSASISETHHLQKLDAPSGTAITLAEEVGRELKGYSSWVLGDVTSPAPYSTIAPAAAPTNGTSAVPIHSIREEGVPGTHTLRLASAVDTLELTHVAHSREGFARGALAAARWMIGRRGTFTMRDFLDA